MAHFAPEFRPNIWLTLLRNEWLTLLRNTHQDLRPFFLTAFHCLDTNEDQQLSQTEQNLNLYTFRFKYEAENPSCPGISTGPQGTWITFSGAMFRAGNSATDFALIELNGTIINQPSIVLIGWDRTGQTPTTTAVIHHPNGDAKKITIDSDPAIQGVLNGVQSWNINSNLGGLQGGSSGSPYFDQNRRIIGQHYGRDLDIRCPGVNQFGGRFDLSWTGGGTNATRLSNWLGGTNPPTISNTIRSPHITPFGTHGGVEFVCNSNKTFTLHNQVPGTTISWAVSNPHLFATSGGSTTSGTGVNATLRAASSFSQGSATITFTLVRPGCPSITISRNIWVGNLPLGSISILGLKGAAMCTNSVYTINYTHSENAPTPIDATFNWTVPSFLTILGGQGTQSITVQTPPGGSGYLQNFGTVSVTLTNPCGQITVNRRISVKYCGPGGGPLVRQLDDNFDLVEGKEDIKFDIFPNPTHNFINISTSVNDVSTIVNISVISTDGRIVKSVSGL